jgi:hypothetical protein
VGHLPVHDKGFGSGVRGQAAGLIACTRIAMFFYSIVRWQYHSSFRVFSSFVGALPRLMDQSAQLAYNPQMRQFPAVPPMQQYRSLSQCNVRIRCCTSFNLPCLLLGFSQSLFVLWMAFVNGCGVNIFIIVRL